MNGLKMLYVILNRSRLDTVLKIGEKHGVAYKTITMCLGTAASKILKYLGLEEAEKVLVNFVIDSKAAGGLLKALNDELSLYRAGHGIAFAVPLASVTGRPVYDMLRGNMAYDGERNTEEAHMDFEYDVIYTIVNRGYAEVVMDAARAAGARGGTIIHANGTKKNGEAEILGVPIMPEKDLVLILTKRETRNAFMLAIAEGAGLNSEGRGFSFALPVSDVMGTANIIESFDNRRSKH